MFNSSKCLCCVISPLIVLKQKVWFSELVAVIMIENINQRDVWSNNLIADFERMVQQHHESLNSFGRVGTLLEASGKIYGHRVDSIHADVIRMSSGIQRQCLQQSCLDSSAASGTTADISVPSIRPIRRKRLVYPTIVGTGESINAPLQSLELACPLNGLFGIDRDHASVANLFQHVLCSDRYGWMLQMKNQFWTDDRVADNLDEFDELDEANVDLPVVNWIPSVADVVRPKLFGYEISNSACEHFRYSQSTVSRENQPNLEENPQIVDIDLHFDVDADPEPVNNLQPTMPAIDVSFDDDGNALRQHSVLHPNTSAVDDLRPLTSTPLSYSYRRLTDVELPTHAASHWRLPFIVQSNRSESGQPVVTRRRRRRKIAERDQPVLFTALSDSVESNFMSTDDPRTRAIRKSNQDKWDPAKLTMPPRMDHSTALTHLPLMLNCTVNEEPIEPNASDASDAIDLDVDNDVDIQLADDNAIDVPQAADNATDFQPIDMDMDIDMDPVDAAPTNISAPNTPVIETIIGDGAPNVDDYVILPSTLQTPFQITPANFDVKAVTRRCMQIILELETAGSEPTFGQVFAQLQADGQRTTPALIFSSILELANRNNFRLEKIGATNDFVIKRI